MEDFDHFTLFNQTLKALLIPFFYAPILKKGPHNISFSPKRKLTTLFPFCPSYGVTPGGVLDSAGGVFTSDPFEGSSED